MNEENNIDAYQPTFQPGALRDPVWYEGQTVFEMGNGKISWKNNIYQSCRRHFIQEADVSVTKWNGRFVNYYGPNGAVFVDVENNNIRTAFRKEQFDERTRKMREVLRKNEKG